MHVKNLPDYFLGTIIAGVRDSPRVGTKELLCEKFRAPRFFPDGRLKVPAESNLQIPRGASSLERQHSPSSSKINQPPPESSGLN